MTFYLQYSALLASPVYARLPAACEGFLYLSLASLARSYRGLTLTLALALALALTLTTHTLSRTFFFAGNLLLADKVLAPQPSP